MQAFNGQYYDMPLTEYVNRKILTQDEADYLGSYRIPYNAGFEAFNEIRRIQGKVTKAIEAGLVDKHYAAQRTATNHYIQSDYVPGGQMLSHADGKIYDSKKRYYDSLKEKGATILESGMKTEKPPTLNEREFDRSFKKALEQHGL